MPAVTELPFLDLGDEAKLLEDPYVQVIKVPSFPFGDSNETSVTVSHILSTNYIIIIHLRLQV